MSDIKDSDVQIIIRKRDLMFKIGFMPTGSMLKLEPEKICDILKGFGYEAVEWPLSFFCMDNKDRAFRKRVIEATRKSGLLLSEVVVQKDYIILDEEARKSNINYTLSCIREFSELGINTINLFTGPIPWSEQPLIAGRDLPSGQAWKYLYRAMDRIVPEAEKFGMRLAVENVWGMLCHDFFTLQHIVKRYDSQMLGVNFDPSHDVLAGHTDIAWLVEEWGNKIFHVHLKDAVGIQKIGKFTFPILGDGLVNWKSFFAAFDKIQYEGVMSVEFEAFEYLKQILDSDAEKAAQLSMKLIKKLLAL